MSMMSFISRECKIQCNHQGLKRFARNLGTHLNNAKSQSCPKRCKPCLTLASPLSLARHEWLRGRAIPDLQAGDWLPAEGTATPLQLQLETHRTDAEV